MVNPKCTVIFSALLITSFNSITHSADFTFTGGTSNVWTENTNWSGGAAPGTDIAGSLLIQTGNSSPYNLTNIDLAYTNIDGLEFTSAGTASSLDLQGTGSFTFNDGASITNNKSFTQSIDIDIVGSGNTLTINAAAAQITIDSGITISDTGGVNLNITGSSDVDINGNISGAGGTVTINVGDSDTVFLDGTNNTFDGGITLQQGQLDVASTGSLGTGDITVTGNADLIYDLSGGTLTIAQDIVINNGARLRMDADKATSDIIVNGSISGAGTLELNSSGDVILNASNNLTGTVEFNFGDVEIGNDQAFGTAEIVVTGGAFIRAVGTERTIANNITINDTEALRIVSGEDMTLNGQISGQGILRFIASDVFTLNGNNTYSGGTDLSFATLALGHNNALGTGSLNLTRDGELEARNEARVLANDISLSIYDLTLQGSLGFTLNGDISGSGEIINNTGQDLVLGGSNTFSGGVTSSSGTVTVNSSNAMGTGTFRVTGSSNFQAGTAGISLSNTASITSGQTLTLSGTNSCSFSGVISGSGALAKSGSSVYTLSATNTFSGGTTLSSGTLVLGNDDALGSGSLAVDGNAAIQSDDDTRAISNNMSVASGVTLTVEGSNDIAVSGVISGDGGLTKDGVGTLTLSGSNTYTGTTTVNAGVLDLTGTLASTNLIVSSGATFEGNGNFNGDLTNTGSITGGTATTVGTLQIGGDLTLGSAGTYDMKISSTSGAGTGNDLLDVTGSSSIDGTLNVDGLSGYSPTAGDTFTILESDGGISGTFATIVDDFANFNVTAAYNANSIVITIRANQADFSAITQRNLFGAADAFERISAGSPSGDIATVIAQLENQSGQALVVAFEQIVPNYLVPQAEATFKGIDVQNNNFNGRLNELRNGLPKLWSNNLSLSTPENSNISESADPEFAMMFAMQTAETLEQQQETNRFSGAGKDIWGAWVNGFGTFGDFDSTLSQAGYEFNTGGVTFGFDYRVLDTLAAGAFVGYSNTGITVDSGQGTSSFNSINTGMYMTWFNEEGFYASGLFGGGVNFYENNRRIVFGTIDRVAESDPTGFYLQALATGGYEFKSGNWGFGPQLALQWVNLQIESHSETGADSLNLDVGAFNGNSFVTRLGFRTTYQYDTSAMLFVPELVGFWEHEYLDPIDTVEVGIPSGPDSFAYSGIGPGRDSGLVGVNLIGISHESPVSFTVQYNVEFTPDDFIVNNVYAGVRISF